MNRLGCFFNELQGIPFGVVGEFGVPLRRAQVCMSHQLADGVKGTFWLASHEQNVWRSVWITTLKRGSVTPSFRPRMFTALVKVLLREVG